MNGWCSRQTKQTSCTSSEDTIPRTASSTKEAPAKQKTEEKSTSPTVRPVQQQVRGQRGQQENGKIEEKEKKAVEKMNLVTDKGRRR